MTKNRGRVLFLLVVVLLVGSQLTRPQTAARQNSSTDLVVVDSAGKTIGSVVGVMQGSHITLAAVPFDGKLLPVEVVRSSFQSSSLFFKTSDCTGQPFQDASSSPFPASAVAPPGQTLYGQHGSVRSITVASILDPNSGCVQAAFPLEEAVPVAPAVNLNMFTPPFKVSSSATQ